MKKTPASLAIKFNDNNVLVFPPSSGYLSYTAALKARILVRLL